MADKWFWYSGSNDEFYQNGPFATREEAIDELYGEGGYIVEAKPQKVAFSAVRMIDDQYFDCEDYFSGENNEPDRKGKFEEANAELQSLINEWLVKWEDTFVQPEIFAATRSEEYIEPEQETGK